MALTVCILLLALTGCGPADEESPRPEPDAGQREADAGQQQPYAGQQRRTIKALSAEEVQAYLAGEGMGYAKAAELNHYPGPRHVLDLAGPLELSPSQLAETRAIYDRMHGEATALGQEIVAREATLDSLFVTRAIDEVSLNVALDELARLEGRLRAVHLLAHLETRSALNPEQITRYDRLRGYEGGGHGSGDHEHGDMAAEDQRLRRPRSGCFSRHARISRTSAARLTPGRCPSTISARTS